MHPSAADKKVFLTGGNGVVGRALVRKLGAERITFLKFKSGIERSDADYVTGDITRPRLGLAERDYRVLASRTDLVVHCAAITNLHEAPERTLDTNVEGTRNVIAFAQAAGVPLIHVSTAFVIDRIGRCGIKGSCPYRDSKRIAERLVKQSGLRWAIIRPSMVVGDSTDGAISQFQGFHSLVACFLRGVIPIIPATPTSICDFIPRDVVADAIAAILWNEDFGKEFWITAGPRALPILRMLELIDAFAERCGHHLDPTRIIEPETVGRLFLPVFLPTLPRLDRLRIERLFEYARYYDVHEPFPSSMGLLGRQYGLQGPDSFEDVFIRNMEYWAETTGYARQPLPGGFPMEVYRAGSRSHA